MDNITIFANGDLNLPKPSFSPDEMVIAADGGARHCLKMGLIPNVVIGDFDSLTENEISNLDTAGAKLLRYPVEKDQTDLELALDYALDFDPNEVTIYGLLGGRWDMTFVNLLLLASPQFNSIRFRIIHGNTTGTILRGGETYKLEVGVGNIVSAVPLNGPAIGITYKGLQWPLENDILPFGSPKGVSNVITSTDAHISIKSGILLVLVINTQEIQI